MSISAPLASVPEADRLRVGAGEPGGGRPPPSPRWPLARAHRWRAMLEDGTYASAAELSAAERINPSYVARLLRLTLLAPEVVEAALNGTCSPAVTLDRLMKPFPASWDEQRLSF